MYQIFYFKTSNSPKTRIFSLYISPETHLLHPWQAGFYYAEIQINVGTVNKTSRIFLSFQFSIIFHFVHSTPPYRYAGLFWVFSFKLLFSFFTHSHHQRYAGLFWVFSFQLLFSLFTQHHHIGMQGYSEFLIFNYCSVFSFPIRHQWNEVQSSSAACFAWFALHKVQKYLQSRQEASSSANIDINFIIAPTFLNSNDRPEIRQNRSPVCP